MTASVKYEGPVGFFEQRLGGMKRPRSAAAQLAVLACALIATAGVTERNCGNPLPSGSAHGTFRRIAFTDRCTSDAAGEFSLALGSIGNTPLFVTETTGAAGCGWSVATVSGSAVKVLASVPDNLFGERVAAGSDESYWATTASHYLAVSASKKPAYIEPFSQGYEPRSVGVGADGRVYGIEQSGGGLPPLNQSLRLIDITDSAAVASLSGWADSLSLGNDGHLYFKVLSERDCAIYEVTDPKHVVKRVSCMARTQFAVARDGTIWRSSFLGVMGTDPRGITKCIGPIEPIPVVGNGVALQPRSLVATPDDTLWFLYDKLWHVDAQGELSSIELPWDVRGTNTMIGTTDGSLWLVVRGGLLQFTPAH